MWRHFNEDLNGFTWCRLKPTPCFSRLDYIIVNDSLVQFITKIELIPAFRSDHSIVAMDLDFSPFPRGPGYWKLNTMFLRIGDYLEKMRKLVEIELANRQVDCRASITWELIKLALKGSSLQYLVRKKKSNQNKTEALERKLKQLEMTQLNQEVLFSKTQKIKLD